jgi:flagellin
MAFNDISLTAGMRSNLLNLQSTATLVSRTQERLASGKKINSALDDPTSFFAAQGLNERASDLSSLKDGMGQAIQTISAANAGISGIQQLIQSAKGIAQSALSTSDTTARASYSTQFDAIVTEVANLASDSGYRGTNLLNGDSLAVTFGSTSMTIAGTSGTNAGLTLAASTNSWATSTDISAATAQLDTATTGLRTTSASLSSSLSIVQARIDFTSSMVSALTGGADKLVLADMNEEGANMLALQTRQSLSTTALSLSSQANQSVLRLFQ